MKEATDQILDMVLFDKERNAFFIFLRKPKDTDTVYTMAQTPDNKVYFIQFYNFLNDLPKGFEIIAYDANETIKEIRISDYLEHGKGVVNRFSKIEPEMRMFTDEPSFAPLDDKMLYDVAIGFGHMFSGSKLVPMPESWLAPKEEA